MTLPRLVTWMLVWGTGWALFFVRPAASSVLGAVLLLAVAPLIMMKPRQWTGDPPSRSIAIVLMLLVLLFLLLVFVLPPSYRWQFPQDPKPAAALKGFGAIVAGFGVAVNWRCFLRPLPRRTP